MLKVVLPTHVHRMIDDGTGVDDPITIEAEDMDSVRRHFARDFPSAVPELFDESGRLKRNVLVVHNDELIPRERVAGVKFATDDTLTLLLQFAGG